MVVRVVTREFTSIQFSTHSFAHSIRRFSLPKDFSQTLMLLIITFLAVSLAIPGALLHERSPGLLNALCLVSGILLHVIEYCLINTHVDFWQSSFNNTALSLSSVDRALFLLLYSSHFLHPLLCLAQVSIRSGFDVDSIRKIDWLLGSFDSSSPFRSAKRVSFSPIPFLQSSPSAC